MKIPALILTLSLSASATAQPGTLPVPSTPPPKAPFPNGPDLPKETMYGLSLKPVGAPAPIMRYELVPSFREQTKGNAALYYHRALHLFSEFRQVGIEAHDARMKFEEQLSKPLAEIPVEALRDWIKPYAGVFRELEAAYKVRDCDWGIGDRIASESYNLLMPELQKTRELAFLLKVRCRLHQKEGNLEAALKDIQIGLTLGRHVGKSETLIAFLVGTAITAVSLSELDHVLQMPKCPNLYWSLSALPRPFIPLDSAVEGELRGLDAILPLTKDLEEPMSTEQARLMLDSFFARMQKFNLDVGANGLPRMGLNETRLALAAYVTLMHPSARKDLLAGGRTEAELNAMPPAQIVLLNSSIKYRSLRDEYMMWLTAPADEAFQGMQKSSQKVWEMRNTPTDMMVTMLTLLLPATQQVYQAQVRTQRRIASLRVVEAVRLHTASFGKAPAKLSDITLVPVPNDPQTNKPFEYSLNDKGFVVTVPPPQGMLPNPGNAWKYQITWSK